MSAESLDFSFDPAGVDRATLLADAAKRLDTLSGNLSGPVLGGGRTSEEGDLVRALIEDQASFAGFPEIYRITDRSFLAQQITAPVQFRALAEQYNFYWLYFPVVLFPRHNWAFNRLELAIKLSGDGAAPHLQARTIQVLPNQQFQDLLTLGTGLEVRLDEQFNLSVKPISLETPAGEAGGGVTAKAAGKLDMACGPFTYTLKRAKIQHSTPGAERVFWRIDGAEFFQEDTPEIIVIAQVPKALGELRAEARLQAYRSFNFGSAGLRQAIAELPQVLREYFQGGAPVIAEASYDLTPRL